MKFCRDCRFIQGASTQTAKCGHENALSKNHNYPVTGEGEPTIRGFCSTMRIGNSDCGESAAWFEPKEVAP